jgi:hypothetical protein
MQFAPVVQMFDKAEIVTDCHKNSVGITGRMCEVLSPQSWRSAEQSCVPRVPAPPAGRERTCACGFGMRRDEAVNLGRSDSARGAYLDPSELTRLEEPIKR